MEIIWCEIYLRIIEETMDWIINIDATKPLTILSSLNCKRLNMRKETEKCFLFPKLSNSLFDLLISVYLAVRICDLLVKARETDTF